MTKYPLTESVVKTISNGETHPDTIELYVLDERNLAIASIATGLDVPNNQGLSEALVLLIKSNYSATRPSIGSKSRPDIDGTKEKLLRTAFYDVVSNFGIRNIYRPSFSVFQKEEWLCEITLALYDGIHGPNASIAKWKPVADAMLVKLLKLHPHLLKTQPKRRRRKK